MLTSRSLSAMTLSALLVTCVYAAPAASATATKVPSAAPTAAPAMNTKAAEDMLNKLTRGQVDIIQAFPSLGNLQGFVVQAKGDKGSPSIVYVDGNGQYAIVGTLLTPDGANQSEMDNQKYINASVAKSALTDITNTAWIQDGNPNAKHGTYVIADPNCIYCHKFYELTRPAVKSGDLSIRWIWVGFLKDSSAGIAKAIMAAPDPLAAMAKNENQFNSDTETGGLAPLGNANADVNAKFDKNMAFLNKYQFPGTPVLIFQDTQGNPMSLYGVSPDDLNKTIQSMAPFSG